MNSYSPDSFTIISRLLQFLLFLAVVGIVVAYFSKRYRIVTIAKNIFAYLLIAGGLIALGAFFIKLTIGDFSTVALTRAVMLALCGILLRKWRLLEGKKE